MVVREYGARGARGSQLALLAVGLVGVAAVLFLWPGVVTQPIVAVPVRAGSPAAPDTVVAAALRRDDVTPAEAAELDDFLASLIGEDAAPKPIEPAQIDAWIRDLRDDDVPRNASHAEYGLWHAGALAHDALVRALGSDDTQQRELAALTLMRTGAEPTELIVATAVDLLATHANDLEVAIGWLCAHIDVAHRRLQWGLGSTNPQQRLLSAFVLAHEGRDSVIVRRVLIDHLADNRIHGDAVMAAHGLLRLGKNVIPALRAAKPYADEQASALLQLIELDLVDPPREHADFVARREMIRITNVYYDPALQYDFNRSMIPQW